MAYLATQHPSIQALLNLLEELVLKRGEKFARTQNN